MSLFIGNLSPRIRRDELQHVFRRFGRCSVQLKDGYGFAVYEFPPNAEKALTALRGKNICGEPIILSWSNKQPRPFHRLARGAGFHEPRQYGRNSTRGEGYFERRLVSNGRPGFKMGIRHPYTDDRRLTSTDTVDEEMDHNQSKRKHYMEENHSDASKGLSHEGGSDEPIQVGNDRWVQEVGEPSNDELENGMEFDRYDPCQSHEKRDEDLNSPNVYSPNLGNSQEKTGRDKAPVLNLNGRGNPRPEPTCYSCGESGHKMRNCPRDDASWRKRISRFDYGQDDEHNYKGRGNFELDGPRSMAGDRRPSGRDSVLMRRPNNDEASDSGKRRRLMKSGHSLGTNEVLKKYTPKKRSRREDGTPRRPHPRTAGSASSPLHPDSPTSSQLQSLKSLSRSSSHFRARSASSRSRSLSANSRSSSMFLPSENSKSRSKSSCPTSLSLSVSLGQPLLSSPNKVQRNPNGSLIKATTPESREVLAEREKSVEANIGSQNTKLDSPTVMVKNGNAMSSDKAVDYFNEIHAHRGDDADNHATSRILDGGTNPSLDTFEKSALVGGSSPPQSMRGQDELVGPKDRAQEYTSTAKLHSEVPLSSRPYNSMKISCEEMGTAMKHYGIEQSGTNYLFVEDYFGSARLWPWEIVYYRRLKKGPISVENYARRIIQNQEFGIVDKYIRSSSGWGELGQDNH